jgi:moderate conductance mechanosensitive channel
MQEWLAPLIKSGVIFALAGFVLFISRRSGARFVRRIEARNRANAARANTLWLVLRRVIAITVVVTTILMLFMTWGIAVTPFLAVGTVVAAALGFGAQNFVKDVIAGFFMLLENQFAVGDVVRVVDVTGTVQDLQLRVTVLRDFEGNIHFVPNGQITVTSNLTSKTSQPVIDMSIAYSADVDHALEVMGDELRAMAAESEWSGRMIEEPEVIGVQNLADSAVIIRARMLTTAEDRWTVKREALRRLKKRFDAEGIEIPFPQVTIHKATEPASASDDVQGVRVPADDCGVDVPQTLAIGLE